MCTRVKVASQGEQRAVIYDHSRWEILRDLRRRAREITSMLPSGAYIHGSVARGDVGPKSDIDIVFLEKIPSYMVEMKLNYISRRIVQATPNSAIRTVYEIDDRVNVILPLVHMRDRELEFYRFGGIIDPQDNSRVMGVNKRLMMIAPTEYGHDEWSIIGREAEAAKLLGISLATVQERVRVLTRRDRIGRTGVYLNEPVPENMSVEDFLRHLADEDPAIRRRVRS